MNRLRCTDATSSSSLLFGGMVLQGCNLVDYNYHLLAKVGMGHPLIWRTSQGQEPPNHLMLRVRIQYAKNTDQLIASAHR